MATATKIPKVGVGLFVNRLHWTISGSCLRKYFKRFGNVLFAEVHIDLKTGLHKGYGWVRMSSEQEVLQALEYKRHTIEGYEANVGRDIRDAREADNHSVEFPQQYAMDLPDLPAPSSQGSSSHTTSPSMQSTPTPPPPPDL